MATVDSSSTDAQVQAAYDDNASYAEDRSVAKARAFLTAARILLRREYAALSDGGSSGQKRVDLIQKEIDSAKEWLERFETYDGVGEQSVTVADLSGTRD